MQAASQALQPMHVDVSMYFETTFAVRMPLKLPRTEAEERRISRFCVLISLLLSCLLELDEEGLELGRPRIGVHGRRSQQVRERARMVLLAGESPVDWEANLPRFLSVDLQRVKALGHHGRSLDRASGRRDSDLRSVVDAFLLGESFRDLHEETGLKLV